MSNEAPEPASSPPRYIVVEGPVGVGKTSLARRLAASFDSDLVLEQAEDNPFLEQFYGDPGHAALPAQLFFLFQRARLVDQMRQTDLFSPVRVADFLLEKDRMFAELNLSPAEFALYRQVFDSLRIEAPAPDLVVYLQAPVEVLIQRIISRGLPYEQSISARYLERLGETYARFFHDFDAAPLLIVNAGTVDLVRSEYDYQELLRVVQRTHKGRHFFNPAPQAIA